MAVYPEKSPLMDAVGKEKILTYFESKRCGFKYSKKVSGLEHSAIKDNAGNIWVKSSHIENGYHKRNPKHKDVSKVSGIGGYFGRINSVQSLADPTEVGVLKKQDSDRTTKELINNQTLALEALGRLKGFQSYETHDGKTVYLTIMKFAKGTSLYDLLHNDNVLLTQSQLVRIIMNLIQEVERIHNSGRVHGDLKLEHVIVNLDDLSVELVDFDLAYLFEDKESKCTKVLDEIRGTEEYLAPELKEHRIYSNKTDIFALGKIINVLFKQCSGPAPLSTLARWMTSTTPSYRPEVEAIRSQLQAIDNAIAKEASKMSSLPSVSL